MPSHLTVLLPVHNAADTLERCLESLYAQTFQDFEINAVVNGSTDDSVIILKTYKAKFGKLKLFYMDNACLPAAVNVAIENSKAPLMARMDADDECFKDRFEKQVRFLEKNTKVGVCGTQLKYFGGRGDGVSTLPLSNVQIKAGLLFENSIAHPTLMINKERLHGNIFRYDETIKASDDYDLWSRMMPTVTFENMAEPLLYYRVHDSQMSRYWRKNRLLADRKIRSRNLRRIFGELPEEVIDIYENVANYDKLSSYRDFIVFERLMMRIYRAGSICFEVNVDEWKSAIELKWLEKVWINASLGLPVFLAFLRSRLSGKYRLLYYRDNLSRAISLYSATRKKEPSWFA